MAMDGDVLGLAIAAVLLGKSTVPPTPDMITNIQDFWKSVGGEMVGHIQKNAEVPLGISVSTTGSPTAQKGATDAPGKVV
jgi:hypothetical protein